MILAKIIIAMATEKMKKLKYEAQDCSPVGHVHRDCVSSGIGILKIKSKNAQHGKNSTQAKNFLNLLNEVILHPIN